MLCGRSVAAIAFIAFLLSACSPGPLQSFIPGGKSGSASSHVASDLQAAPQVPNVFARAVGMKLDDGGIDSYIDASIVGADRKLAHALMKLMPANRRGDFAYYDGKRILSNNPALLPYLTLTAKHANFAMTSRPMQSSVSGATSRKPAGVGSCSPPDPYIGSGPYVREVGNCGFTGGWSIVNLTCGTTLLNTPYSENGFMYMEERATNGAFYEGGMFTRTGTQGSYDINPYISGNFNMQLNNSGARYTCGTDIGLMFGPVYPQTGEPSMMYVAIGTIPNYNPANAWQPTEEVQMQNAAWLYIAAPSGLNQPGTDNTGIPTPCMQCAVTKVTSIGDTGGDIFDGSTFGIDLQGNLAVHWEEVTFGNWQSDCSGSLCTLAYSTNQSYWYAGKEAYPNDYDGQADFNPAGAVWESWDGIVANPGSILGTKRSPRGSFVVPAPPKCTPDSYGYCVAETGGPGLSEQWVGCMEGTYGVTTQQLVGETWYYIQNSRGALMYAAYKADDPNGAANCGDPPYWSPQEPRVQFNDPNLP
jgi:hypothetical protein